MEQHFAGNIPPLAAVEKRNDQSQQHRRTQEADAVEGKGRQDPDRMLHDQKGTSPHHRHDEQAEVGNTGAVQMKSFLSRFVRSACAKQASDQIVS